MPNYLDIIGECFPTTEAYVLSTGDPTVYNDIQWISTPIPQATLDASECATIGIPSGVTKQFTFGDSKGNPLESKNSNFKRVRSFQYEGNNYSNSPIKINFTCWVDSNATGELRILDVDNEVVICTQTITNTIESIIINTTATNWPTTLTLMEIQLRKTTGTGSLKVYLSGMTLIF